VEDKHSDRRSKHYQRRDADGESTKDRNRLAIHEFAIECPNQAQQFFLSLCFPTPLRIVLQRKFARDD